MYAVNSPLNWLDPLGLRNVSFVFYYNLTEEELPRSARATAEQIVLRCLRSCCGEEHTFSFTWYSVTQDVADVNLGFSGGGFLGFAPTRVGLYVRRNTDARATGRNYERWRSWINTQMVEEAADDRYAVGMAVAIVHEAVYHGLGFMFDPGAVWRIPAGKSGQYVDDPSPSAYVATPQLSPAACDEICDWLDVEGGRSE